MIQPSVLYRKATVTERLPLSRIVINADEDFVCHDYVNIAFKWLLQNVCSCSATGGQDTLPFFPSLFSQISLNLEFRTSKKHHRGSTLLEIQRSLPGNGHVIR